MTTDELREFFEKENFNVHLFEEDGEQCAEIEKWTDGGVDMIITLQPFTKEEFIQRVNDFDIDEQIDLHREGDAYRKDFTIRESLEDFENFEKHLKEIVNKLVLS